MAQLAARRALIDAARGISASSSSDQRLSELAAVLPKGPVAIAEFEALGGIGSGGFGRVYRAKHKTTGTEVAIKEMYIDGRLTGDRLASCTHEIEMLLKCRLPFCMSLLAFTVEPPYSIVMPFAQNGSLFSFTRADSTKERLSPSHKTLIAIGTAYGMAHLHDANVIHRDLKSMNILLDGRLLPFIADFGLSRVVEEGAPLTRECGSCGWMAPEQMVSDNYDERVDVYAFGMVLYEMVAHQMPWQGTASLQIANAVAGGRRPSLPAGDNPVHGLIERCWHQSPRKRPPFRKIFKKLVGGKYWFEGTQRVAVEKMVELVESIREHRSGGLSARREERHHHHHHPGMGDRHGK